MRRVAELSRGLLLLEPVADPGADVFGLRLEALLVLGGVAFATVLLRHRSETPGDVAVAS